MNENLFGNTMFKGCAAILNLGIMVAQMNQDVRHNMNTSNHYFSLLSYKGVKLKNRYEAFGYAHQLESATDAFFDDLICYFDNPELISANEFYHYDINTLVPYLKVCHKDYLENQIPLIQNAIEELKRTNGSHHPFFTHATILFSDFFIDLTKHIELEEEKLYPYAMMLNNSLSLADMTYSTAQFELDHKAHSLNFEDLINYVAQFAEDFSSNFAFNQLESRLIEFKQDMDLHELLEDEVLLPKMEQLERKTGLLL